MISLKIDSRRIAVKNILKDGSKRGTHNFWKRSYRIFDPLKDKIIPKMSRSEPEIITNKLTIKKLSKKFLKLLVWEVIYAIDSLFLHHSWFHFVGNDLTIGVVKEFIPFLKARSRKTIE